MSLPLLGQATYNDKLAKKGWEQLYRHACEDFAIHNDLHRFIKDLQVWMTIVNNALSAQIEILSNHTHATSQGPTSPPTTSYLMVWKGSQYALPQFVNTSGIKPNIMDTGSGFTSFATRTIKPTVNLATEFIPVGGLV